MQNVDCVGQQFEIYAIGRLHGEPVLHDDTVYLRSKASATRDAAASTSWSWFSCNAEAEVKSLDYDKSADTMVLSIAIFDAFRVSIDLKRRGGKQRRKRIPVLGVAGFGGMLGDGRERIESGEGG